MEAADSEPVASPSQENKAAMAELFVNLSMTQETGNSNSVAKTAEEEVALVSSMLAQQYLSAPGPSIFCEKEVCFPWRQVSASRLF